MPNLPPIADTVEHAEAAVRTARTEFRRMRQARDRGEVPDAAISAARTAFRQQVAGKALTQLRCDLGTRERWRRHLDEIESVQLAGADMVGRWRQLLDLEPADILSVLEVEPSLAQMCVLFASLSDRDSDNT